MSNNWTINQTVDLARGIDKVEVWPRALMYVGDKNAHTWNVTILDNGVPSKISGGVTGYFIRHDGTTVYVHGNLEGNVASVTLDDDCYAFEGDLRAMMRIASGESIITISALLFQVRHGITDQIIDPGDTIPTLDELLAQIENVRSAASAVNDAIEKANSAAENADIATQNANDATTKAKDATSSATNAASSANAAAAKAEASIKNKLYDTAGQNTDGAMTQRAVTEAIDGIQVGGRNYARGTETPIVKGDGYTGENDGIILYDCYCPSNAQSGSLVTLSCTVKAEGIVLDASSGHSIRFMGRGYPSGTSYDSDDYTLGRGETVGGSREYVVNAGNSVMKCAWVIRLNANHVTQKYWGARIRVDGVASGTLTISEFKFESGNKATDWTPNPYDVKSQIDELKQMILDLKEGA